MDAKTYTSPLRPGSYTDDGCGTATNTVGTDGVWTISPRLPYDAHLSGSGRVVVDVATTRPNANLVVKVVGGSVTLRFLSRKRTATIQGDPGT